MVLNPLISVILPVYNAAPYLKESMDSILMQTYSNLEIIIINDGSSDESKQILDSYKDTRIRMIHHEQNKGLIYALNEGIQIAKGELIVRMDADDIAFNDRIEKQLQYLIAHPQIAIVGAHAICFENDINTHIPNWALDERTLSPAEIKKALIWENCMVHPSICMRTKIAKLLLYDPAQKNYEDYDFWLRTVASNMQIAKINEPLLYYRVQKNSITQTSIRKSNFFFQKAGVKGRFLKKQLAALHFNLFIAAVGLSILADLLMGVGKLLKQNNQPTYP